MPIWSYLGSTDGPVLLSPAEIETFADQLDAAIAQAKRELAPATATTINQAVAMIAQLPAAPSDEAGGKLLKRLYEIALEDVPDDVIIAAVKAAVRDTTPSKQRRNIGFRPTPNELRAYALDELTRRQQRLRRLEAIKAKREAPREPAPAPLPAPPVETVSALADDLRQKVKERLTGVQGYRSVPKVKGAPRAPTPEEIAAMLAEDRERYEAAGGERGELLRYARANLIKANNPRASDDELVELARAHKAATLERLRREREGEPVREAVADDFGFTPFVPPAPADQLAARPALAPRSVPPARYDEDEDGLPW